MAGATRNCCHLGACSVYTIQPCTMSLHAKRFWQNDRGLLRATAVTREIILYPVVIHHDAEDCSVSPSRCCLVTVRTTGLQKWLPVKYTLSIDELRKSKGLHSVSAYGHGPVYIYRSRPAGEAQSRHAFVGGTWASEHVGKMTDTRKQKEKKKKKKPHQTCRSDSRFPQLVV